MSTITELIGLPGSGKSHHAQCVSKHKHMSGVSHIVDLGVDKNKIINTLCAIKDDPIIFGLLGILFIVNIRKCFSRVEARPYLVVLERLGRNRRIKLATKAPALVDEGTFQFVWRIFCNLELSRTNLLIGECILGRLSALVGHAEYVLVSKACHLERVSSRNKQQKFDIALIADDATYIKACRASMYCLVVFLRRSSISFTARRI